MSVVKWEREKGEEWKRKGRERKNGIERER